MCTATHHNTLQHTATHCNTLQHAATHGNTPRTRVYMHTVWVCNHQRSTRCTWSRGSFLRIAPCTRSFLNRWRRHQRSAPCTAYCIWSVISSISNFNWWSGSLGLFCHVPLKRDQGHWDWKLRLNNTPNAIGCTSEKRSIYTYDLMAPPPVAEEAGCHASYMCHDSFMCVAGPIHMCDIMHLCIWYDSFVQLHPSDLMAPPPVAEGAASLSVPFDQGIWCVTWLIHMYYMTHS